MISYKATEEENLNISKVIADCQDALQQKVLQKLIGRSGKKKQIFRKLAMFSKEIDYVMTDMEMLKYQNATSIPAQAIRQL